MGKRGPKPRPKARITTPQTEIACPEWLGPHGQAEHARCAAELRAQGRLTRDCGPALEGIAAAYQLLRAAEAEIEERGVNLETKNGVTINPAIRARASADASWRGWMVQAGLTPRSLAGLEIKTAPEGDELDTFRITG